MLWSCFPMTGVSGRPHQRLSWYCRGSKFGSRLDEERARGEEKNDRRRHTIVERFVFSWTVSEVVEVYMGA